MARQLLAAGEKVQQVILLDTPITEPSILSIGDRVQMLWQGLRDGGLDHWLRARRLLRALKRLAR